jgi:hypothetical protein
MKLEIWQADAKQSEVTLGDGEYSAGGGPGDALELEGERSGAARLWIEGQRLSIESDERIEVGGLNLPARMRRLVLPGERIAVGAHVLVAQADPQASSGTRALAFGLLAGEVDLEPPASLTCLTGLDAGRVFPLSGAQVELGRGVGVDVRLRDRAISRRHARLGREGERFFIEDLDSPNGLYVDGARAKRRATIEDGALIEIGQTLLRFKAPVPVAAPAPEPVEVPHPIEEPQLPGAADEAPVEAPRASGDFWLMGLGVLVFVIGILVTASCLSPAGAQVLPHAQAGASTQVR